MVLPKNIKEFAKERGYSAKELCTGRYELKREYEIMAVKAVIDKNESEVEIGTYPRMIPLILASAVVAATFLPLIIFVYIFYAAFSGMRIKEVKKDLKNLTR